jgi:hypothetical protein
MQRPAMNHQDETDTLVSRLSDPVSFAEENCEWYSDDYYLDCEEDDGDWVPADGSDYSINDAAMDAIRTWVADSEDNLQVLRQAANHLEQHHD